jgi:hypothetical protein
MKLLVLTILAIVSMLLSACQIAGALWLEAYRYKGGYYDRPSQTQTQQAKP